MASEAESRLKEMVSEKERLDDELKKHRYHMVNGHKKYSLLPGLRKLKS